MDWLQNDIPHWLQWVGLLATVLGAGLAFWAALSAKGAKEQATEAKLQAIRLGSVLRLGDLIFDMQELQAMISRKDFHSISAKCSHLRGRVVRFKTESYNLLSESAAADLDLVREQLEAIGRVAATGKGLDENRLGRIQLAFGHANESINRVFAIHHAEASGGG